MATSMNLCNSSHAIAPHSPSRLSFSHYAAQFYSVPTSPTTVLKTLPFVSPEDSYEDDFEFETSLRTSHNQILQKQEPWCRQDLVSVALADELFCNDQVMTLKPPPRLQYVSNQRPSATSPSSLSSVPKSQKRHWSFSKSNANDFDPFMVALENVRNEARGRDLNNHHRRRTRSLSPLRFPFLGSKGFAQESLGKQSELKKPTMARPVSRKRFSRKCTVKPTMTTLPGPKIKASKSFCEGDTNRDGEECEGTLRPYNGALTMSPGLRNSSSKPVGKAHSYEQKKHLAVQELRKGRVIRYKAPIYLLVCFGFGRDGLMALN